MRVWLEKSWSLEEKEAETTSFMLLPAAFSRTADILAGFERDRQQGHPSMAQLTCCTTTYTSSFSSSSYPAIYFIWANRHKRAQTTILSTHTYFFVSPDPLYTTTINNSQHHVGQRPAALLAFQANAVERWQREDWRSYVTWASSTQAGLQRGHGAVVSGVRGRVGCGFQTTAEQHQGWLGW